MDSNKTDTSSDNFLELPTDDSWMKNEIIADIIIMPIVTMIKSISHAINLSDYLASRISFLTSLSVGILFTTLYL